MNEAGALLGTDESITALRMTVLGGGLFAAALWARGRQLGAWLLVAACACLTLWYWLRQVAPPFGLGFDQGLSELWAQTAVNAALGRSDLGFVWGTDAARSLVANLAAFGLPLEMAFRMAEVEACLLLFLLALLPFIVLRSRTTATFASVLVICGGLWPGRTILDGALARPGGAAAAIVVVLGMAVGWRVLRVRNKRTRPALAGMSGALFLYALTDDTGSARMTTLLLSLASVVLASPLRVAVRGFSGAPARARQTEAVVLLAVFSGSGLFWWNPSRTTPGFVAARDEDAAIMKPVEWLRKEAGRDDVLLTSRHYGAILAARTGHRVLYLQGPGEGEDLTAPEPARRARFSRSVREGHPLARLAEHYGVTFLFLGPGEAAPDVSAFPDPPNEPTLDLRLVYQDAEDFRIFRFTKK